MSKSATGTIDRGDTVGHDRYLLQCNQMQLVFERMPGGQEYGYRVDVRDGENWRPVSAPGNPLVRGPSFDLFPSELQQDEPGVLRCTGRKRIAVDGPEFEYTWIARIDADAVRGWVHVDVDLSSPREIPLAMVDGYEPEITLDLGPLPPYERGDHIWFKTSITNPTQWSDDAYANDFPATYYYDPYLRLELMMFFDMTAMSWMSFENIARFLNYRCGLRRRYRPKADVEVGLYADGFSGKVFPAGSQRFGYWLSARQRNDIPDAPLEQEALQRLVNSCLGLLPVDSPWPARATSWQEFSLNCAREMMDSEHCWGRDEHGEFILNYVDGCSPAWKEALEARGRSANMMHPCLESALWAAHPLSVLCAVETAPAYTSLQQRLLAFARPMMAERRAFILTEQVERGAPSGVWQYLYALEEAWQVAMFEKDAELVEMIQGEVEQRLIPFARNVHHIFPLLFDRGSLQKCGSGDTHAVAGLYANFMLDLHAKTGRADYLEEAEQALLALYHLPLNAISQEVFLTAHGVQAASRLFTLSGDEQFAEAYRYLLAQTLRQMYWYSDRTTAETRDVNILGMFQACTPMNYSALFENIETLARIAPTFKTFGVDIGVLRTINHARKNNFYFYQQCLPDRYHTSPLNYIPHENIPILEGPRSASVGQEIYGAGWTFRAYLLWEAYGRCDDRDAMLLNLDGFGERDWLDAPRWRLFFVAYNPGPEPKSTSLFFPVAQGREATLATGERPEHYRQAELVHDGRFALTLQPRRPAYLLLDVTR